MDLYLVLQLPTIIQSKEDIKIVYHFLNKLSNCSFEYGEFDEVIFNSEALEFLFGNSSKQFYIQKCLLFMDYFSENKLKIALNYLCVSGTLAITFPPNKDMTNYTDILFEILMKEDKFNEVHLNSNNLQTLFDIIINHIETSTKSSKMVATIELNGQRINLTSLNERAEKIEDDNDDDDYLITKYRLSNKFNPKIKYSILYKEELEELIIKQIYC
ncbi:unnamed protein product [Meloidogyne enterolobii]|uniref:Uncharacterized protein n=1 Tax=Meloidogyne enterolobii TaxID=390850 RepID=A0ACB0YQ58_MELEN